MIRKMVKTSQKTSSIILTAPNKVFSSIFGVYCVRALGAWAMFHSALTAFANQMGWAIVLCISGLLVIFASLKGNDYKLIIPFNKKINKKLIISYKLIKNIGLWTMAVWCTAHYALIISSIYLYRNIPYYEGSSYPLIIFLCVMMTKATEPKI